MISMINCLICNKIVKNNQGLVSHMRFHNISIKEYYDKFMKNKYEDICVYCGKITNFYGIKRGYSKYCSNKCTSTARIKSKEERLKISNSNKGRIITNETRLKISKSSKGRIVSVETRKKMSKARKNNISASVNGFASYNHYNKQINWVEETRKDPSDERILNVKCINCRQWFRPVSNQVNNRIQGLYNDIKKFYCSNNCKQSCSIFGKRTYRVDHPKFDNEIRDPYWIRLVKTRDKNICQICSKRGNIAHHINPVKTNPYEANDIDNGICVCDDCHKHVHSLPHCSTGQLASLICV